MTKKEQSNVANRRSLIEQHEYLARLCDADLQDYILRVVCPRVGLSSDSKVKLSDDLSYLEAIESSQEKPKPKIVSDKKN